MKISVSQVVIPYQRPASASVSTGPGLSLPRRDVGIAPAGEAGRAAGETMCQAFDVFNVTKGAQQNFMAWQFPAASGLSELSDPKSDKVQALAKLSSAALGLGPETAEVQSLSIIVGGVDFANRLAKGTLTPLEGGIKAGKLVAQTCTAVAEHCGMTTVAGVGRVVTLLLQTADSARLIVASLDAHPNPAGLSRGL